MTPNSSIRKAMDVLDSLPETVDGLVGSRDSDSVERVVDETSQALETLGNHHAEIAGLKREASSSLNGHKR